VVATRPRSKVDFEDRADHGDERRGKARVIEDTNDPHEWPCDSGSRVGLMAQIERDGVRLAGKDQSTRRIQAEGSATEVRHRRLLPIGVAADYLGVSRATVERLVCRGELPIVKVAGTTRYDVEDLDDYIEINRCRNRKRTA
jgi:excisionase family DNA binding protein